jgi:DEAD/DEAH box helicase domain-containing protein
VRLNRQIVGFKKLKFYTSENVGAGKLSMPEQEMHTTSFWLTFPAEFLAGGQPLSRTDTTDALVPAEKQNGDPPEVGDFSRYSSTDREGGLAGLGNVLRTVGSLLLMCDPRDLGVAFTSEQEKGAPGYEPSLYLYDNFPGGIGQSEPLFQMRRALIEKAGELLAACPCKGGCPSCVGPQGEVGEKAKEVAQRIVAAILADGRDL